MARFFGATAAAALALVLWVAAADATPAQRGEAPIGSSWSSTASSVRGQNGSRFLYVCPAGGSIGAVWGTDVYTDDSSVCSAGVHAGVIGAAQGGTLTIEIRPPQSSYTGSTRNGVTTSSWGSWHGSFVIVGGASGGAGSGAKVGGTGWGADPRAYRGQNGTLLSFVCPAGGSPSTVWGSTVYTDDSSVCTAAVHVGLISLAGGGTVTIQLQAGRSSYTGSVSNGITTHSYGSWGGSFVFPGRSAGGTATTTKTTTTAAPAGAVASTWTATATSWRGQIGKLLTYRCPAGGAPHVVWGTGIYTDDSSVCTAAVHAGLISFSRGGTVQIRMQAARTSYVGSTRYGVTSRSYGRWHGSFVFVR